MTGFELWIPGVGSDRSTNWATATSHLQCLIIDMKSFFKKKWANPGLFFVYFRSFQTNITKFYNKYMWKNVHPVYSDGILTHDLWNVSLFP